MDYIFVVKRNNLEIKHKGKNIVIDLSSGGQEHGDILDDEIYRNLIKQGLSNEKLKAGSTEILLSNEVTYYKFYPMVKGRINPAEIDLFKEGLPIEPDNIELRILIGKDKYGVVGINKMLYKILEKLLEESKWKVESIKTEIFKNKNGREWNFKE